MPRESVRLAAVYLSVCCCLCSKFPCLLFFVYRRGSALFYQAFDCECRATVLLRTVQNSRFARSLLLHVEVVVAEVRHTFWGGFGEKFLTHDRCTVVFRTVAVTFKSML